MRTLAIVLICGLWGCASDSPDSGSTARGLVLSSHTETEISGVYEGATGRMSFSMVETTPQVFDLTFDFGDEVLAFSLDYLQGVGEFMPSAETFTVPNHALMTSFNADLLAAIRSDSPSQLETAANDVSSLMLIIPTGEAIKAFTFEVHRGNGIQYLSCTPSWQYLGCANGTSPCYWGMAGNNAPYWCTGRCGIGCGPDNMFFTWHWGSGKYTQDCALHDYGFHGWTNAADDYTYGWFNCP